MDGARERFGKVARYPLHEGDLVRLVTGTGGGAGDPPNANATWCAPTLRTAS